MVLLVVNRDKAVVLTVGGRELCCSREAEFGQTGLKGATLMDMHSGLWELMRSPKENLVA